MKLAAAPSPRPAAAILHLPSTILVFVLLFAATGCKTTPYILKDQPPIDRALVDYPAGFELRPYVRGLTGPSAFCFDSDDSLIIAESGIDNDEPKIFGFKKDGAYFDIYPRGKRIPFISRGFRMYAPIGGIVATGGKIFVTH